MTLDKTHAIIASVFFAIGALCGFFLGKSMYRTEDAAWLQGYIMRLIVRAMRADGTM